MAKEINLEKLAKEIYNECLADGEEVTMEEALEMAKMEVGAKDIKNYVQSDKPREKKERKVKLDDEKVTIIKFLDLMLKKESWLDNVNIANPQKEVTFKIGENDYTLSLIKHRKKK